MPVFRAHTGKINQFISVLYVSEIHTTYELAGSLMTHDVVLLRGLSFVPCGVDYCNHFVFPLRIALRLFSKLDHVEMLHPLQRGRNRRVPARLLSMLDSTRLRG